LAALELSVVYRVEITRKEAESTAGGRGTSLSNHLKIQPELEFVDRKRRSKYSPVTSMIAEMKTKRLHFYFLAAILSILLSSTTSAQLTKLALRELEWVKFNVFTAPAT
jgi:hypothetical protein